MPNGTCSLPYCTREGRLRREVCGLHYKRLLAGTPLDAPARPASWAGVTCSVDGCDREVTAKGMCSLHWQRDRRGIPVTALVKNRNAGKPCAFADCEKPSRKRGWCVGHYTRWLQHGDPGINNAAVRGTCSVETCDREHHTHGYCVQHARRAADGRPLEAPFKPWRVTGVCSEDGCEERPVGHGRCRLHWERARYAADPEPFKARVALRRQRAGKLSDVDREISEGYRYAIRNDRCTYCAADDAPHTDHIFPIAKGGTNHWWNLARACQRCNLEKWARCGTWFRLSRGLLESPRSVPAVA